MVAEMQCTGCAEFKLGKPAIRVHARCSPVDGSESGASSRFLNMFAFVILTLERTWEEEHTGASELEDHSASEHESHTIHEAPIPTAPIGNQFFRIGFESMDLINMLDIWKIRGKLMKSVPKFMQRVYWCAMWCALDAVIVRESQGDVPRMFLFAPAAEVRCPRTAVVGMNWSR